jgi:hypothetical protein
VQQATPARKGRGMGGVERSVVGECVCVWASVCVCQSVCGVCGGKEGKLTVTGVDEEGSGAETGVPTVAGALFSSTFRNIAASPPPVLAIVPSRPPRH